MQTVKYSIKEFSDRVGVSEYTLRYYEKEGLIKPARYPNGIRYYTNDDIEWMDFLLRLKKTGMKMTGLKKYIDLRAKGNSTLAERRQMLVQRQRVIEKRIKLLQASLPFLADKIAWYDDQLAGKIPAGQPYAEYLRQKRKKGISWQKKKSSA